MTSRALTPEEILALPEAQDARERISAATPSWWEEREQHIDLVTVLTVRARMRATAEATKVATSWVRP